MEDLLQRVNDDPDSDIEDNLTVEATESIANETTSPPSSSKSDSKPEYVVITTPNEPDKENDADDLDEVTSREGEVVVGSSLPSDELAEHSEVQEIEASEQSSFESQASSYLNEILEAIDVAERGENLANVPEGEIGATEPGSLECTDVAANNLLSANLTNPMEDVVPGDDSAGSSTPCQDEMDYSYDSEKESTSQSGNHESWDEVESEVRTELDSFFAVKISPLKRKLSPKEGFTEIYSMCSQIVGIDKFKQEVDELDSKVVETESSKVMNRIQENLNSIDEEDMVLEGLHLFDEPMKRSGRRKAFVAWSASHSALLELLCPRDEFHAYVTKEHIVANITMSVKETLVCLLSFLSTSGFVKTVLQEHVPYFIVPEPDLEIYSRIDKLNLFANLGNAIECLSLITSTSKSLAETSSDILVICILLLQEEENLSNPIWSCQILSLMKTVCSGDTSHEICVKAVARKAKFPLILHVVKLLKPTVFASLKKSLLKELLSGLNVTSLEMEDLKNYLDCLKYESAKLETSGSSSFYRLYLIKEYVDIGLDYESNVDLCRQLSATYKEISNRIYPQSDWSSMVKRMVYYWSLRYSIQVTRYDKDVKPSQPFLKRIKAEKLH
ncbi:hypothetical protein HDE_01205 [Halotydeus destructor]|nr:hypothetical protein HDE_01205 [Halotydeus destructor]